MVFRHHNLSDLLSSDIILVG